ncbi:MAG TPA: hypothetical protein PKD00_06910 [Burkholderiales bacterium]|nr:hypothetical protein [Burkholderiales bacterium]
MQYYYSPQSKGFYVDNIHGANIPNDGVKINQKQYTEFFAKQSSGKFTWDFNGKSFIYTEVIINYEEIAKTQLIAKAKILLLESDWQVLPDKFNNYSLTKQKAIIEYREQLREVVRGNVAVIPKMSVL